MSRATGSTVGKLCEAQAKLDDARNLIGQARGDLIRNAQTYTPSKDFRDTPLDQALNLFGGVLVDQAYILDNLIREVAALIPRKPPTEGAEQ